MIPKPLTAIDAADIDALLANQVPERRTIDYKQALPGGSDSEKKEFLADVSSMANTSGGDLLYGVAEAAGVPTAVPGIQTANVDAEIARLNSIILAGLAPRVRHDVRAFAHGTATVPVLRVEESWVRPHRVGLVVAVPTCPYNHELIQSWRNGLRRRSRTAVRRSATSKSCGRPRTPCAAAWTRRNTSMSSSASSS
jgi:hypothetical protein